MPLPHHPAKHVTWTQLPSHTPDAAIRGVRDGLNKALTQHMDPTRQHPWLGGSGSNVLHSVSLGRMCVSVGLSSAPQNLSADCVCARMADSPVALASVQLPLRTDQTG